MEAVVMQIILYPSQTKLKYKIKKLSIYDSAVVTDCIRCS